MDPLKWQSICRRVAVGALAMLVAFTAASCGCRRTADKASESETLPATAPLHRGAAATKVSAVPLPRPATTSGAADGQPPSLAKPATATAASDAYLPGAEGTLHGLADADGYLQKVRSAVLAERDGQGGIGTLSRQGELALRREWAGAQLSDGLVATAASVTLRTAGVAGQLRRNSTGCRLLFQEGTDAEGQSSACPEEADDALMLAAAWIALGRADLAAGLKVEAFQAADDMTLRLAMPAWHLRWLVRLDRNGKLRGIDLPARRLALRFGPGPDGNQVALVQRKNQLVWRWQVGAATGAAQPWQLAGPPSCELLTSWAALGPLGEELQRAVAAAQAVRVGPISMELNKIADGYCVKGLRAPVIAAVTSQLPGHLQLASTRAVGAVLAKGRPATDAPAQLLGKRTERCLLVTVAVPHPGLRGGEGPEFLVQACEGAVGPMH